MAFCKGLKLARYSQSEVMRMRVSFIRAFTAAGCDFQADALRSRITAIRQAQRSRVGLWDSLASQLKNLPPS